jgi:hypothetical protein
MILNELLKGTGAQAFLPRLFHESTLYRFMTLRLIQFKFFCTQNYIPEEHASALLEPALSRKLALSETALPRQ